MAWVACNGVVTPNGAGSRWHVGVQVVKDGGSGTREGGGGGMEQVVAVVCRKQWWHGGM